MTRLDRLLKLLNDYDDLAAVALQSYCIGRDCRKMLTYLRQEKEKLTQELIEHGCPRGVDRISQDIFLEKPAMQKQTWSGGW